MKGEKGMYSLLQLKYESGNPLYCCDYSQEIHVRYEVHVTPWSIYNTDSDYCQHQHSKNNLHIGRDLGYKKSNFIKL